MEGLFTYQLNIFFTYFIFLIGFRVIHLSKIWIDRTVEALMLKMNWFQNIKSRDYKNIFNFYLGSKQ